MDSSADGFEWSDAPASQTQGGCRAGHFDADSGADLVCSDEQALRVHVGGASGPIVETAADDVFVVDTRDVDADGIDDLAVTPTGAGNVEVWRGSASGVFEQTAEVSRAGDVWGAFAMLEPPRIDLVVLDLSELHVYAGDGAGGFAVLDAIEAPSTGYLVTVRDDDRDVVLTNWSSQQWESYGNVSMIGRGDDGALARRAYDISPDWPAGEPVAGDFDDDGELELITSRFAGGDGRTDVACRSGDAYVECGTTHYTHDRPRSVALPSPWRLVDTGVDGTWLTPITASQCP